MNFVPSTTGRPKKPTLEFQNTMPILHRPQRATLSTNLRISIPNTKVDCIILDVQAIAERRYFDPGIFELVAHENCVASVHGDIGAEAKIGEKAISFLAEVKITEAYFNGTAGSVALPIAATVRPVR